MEKRKILTLLPTTWYLGARQWNYRRVSKRRYEQYQNKRTLVTDNGYSYKPFDEKKAIFVHIPKCAGISVSKALFGNLAGGHTTFDQYLDIFEPRCIHQYFKFTIVRNPWDRLVSAYFFLKGGGYDQQDRRWFESELADYESFDDFVINWLNKKNIWKWYHFQPQYHYMLDSLGKVSLDFIGFVENLEEDFRLIASQIGVNASLSQSNRSQHKGYQHYYSDETIARVSEVYAEDIKLLGYRFDNSSLHQQITGRQKTST
ncbi:MAG: hypothetical protein C9356_02025 [Oleiphilus sp.]|nr:MAG: hypothetical protein C9356_02025 [Oleiphilus sp.]